jgi:hypothetical protein
MGAIFRHSISGLAFLVLLGCATAQPLTPPATDATPPVSTDDTSATRVGLAAGFGGLWYVSGVFPTATAQASVADPHLGAALVIDGAEVSDVNGQRCLSPSFLTGKTDAKAIGFRSAAAGMSASGMWERLVVNCDGKTFATYIRMPAEALLQQRPEALYLLERAERILHRKPSEHAEAPVPAKGAPAKATPQETASPAEPTTITPKIVPAPIAEGPVAAQPEAPKKASSALAAGGNAKLPPPGTAIHLASYKGQSAAKRGWKILLGEYDELDPLSPLYVAVAIPGQGEIIRLYATGEGNADLAKVCMALKAKKAYCSLNP